MMSVVYDAGVLVAADRNARRVWADHRARLEAGIVPATTAPVVAQVSRSPRQVQLRRFLRGCDIAPFGPGDAHATGALMGVAGSSDVVDAQLALLAAARSATVFTSDPEDLQTLSHHLPSRLTIRRI